MNRRSFLHRLGLATAGAVATLAIDPDELLWTPGKKTIVGFGATKQFVPATDLEVVQQATKILLTSTPYGPLASRETYREIERARRQLDSVIGGMKLELFEDGREATFHYDRNDKLIGKYSEADMELLNKPLLNKPLYPRKAWNIR